MKYSQFSFPQKRQPQYSDRHELIEDTNQAFKDRIPFIIEIETKKEYEKNTNNTKNSRFRKERSRVPSFHNNYKDDNSFLRELSSPFSEDVNLRDLEMRDKLLFLANFSQNINSYNEKDGLTLQKKKVEILKKKPSNINLVTSILYPSLKINHSKLKSLKSLVFNPEINMFNSYSQSFTNSKKKFVKIALAHLYSKKKTCENRNIYRGIRLEKGGVIDFACKESTGKNLVIDIKKKANSKTYEKLQMKRNIINLKDRIKAAKTIQEWWRNLLNKFSTFCVKIVKIQSVWRGYLIRNNLFEYLYYRIVSVSLLNTLKKIVRTLLKDVVMSDLKKQYALLLKIKLISRIQKKFKEFLESKKKKRLYVGFNSNNNISSGIECINKIINRLLFRSLVHEIFSYQFRQLKSKFIKRAIRKYMFYSEKKPVNHCFYQWKMKRNFRPNIIIFSNFLKSLLRRKLLQSFFDIILTNLDCVRTLKNLIKRITYSSFKYYLNKWRFNLDDIRYLRIRKTFKEKILKKMFTDMNIKLMRSHIFKWLKWSNNFNKRLLLNIKILEGSKTKLSAFLLKNSFKRLMISLLSLKKLNLIKIFMKKKHEKSQIIVNKTFNLWQKYTFVKKITQFQNSIEKYKKMYQNLDTKYNELFQDRTEKFNKTVKIKLTKLNDLINQLEIKRIRIGFYKIFRFSFKILTKKLLLKEIFSKLDLYNYSNKYHDFKGWLKKTILIKDKLTKKLNDLSSILKRKYNQIYFLSFVKSLSSKITFSYKTARIKDKVFPIKKMYLYFIKRKYLNKWVKNFVDSNSYILRSLFLNRFFLTKKKFITKEFMRKRLNQWKRNSSTVNCYKLVKAENIIYKVFTNKYLKDFIYLIYNTKIFKLIKKKIILKNEVELNLLERYLDNWKDNTQRIKYISLKNNFLKKIILHISKRNSNILLRKKLKAFKTIFNAIENLKHNNLSLGINKLLLLFCKNNYSNVKSFLLLKIKRKGLKNLLIKTLGNYWNRQKSIKFSSWLLIIKKLRIIEIKKSFAVTKLFSLINHINCRILNYSFKKIKPTLNPNMIVLKYFSSSLKKVKLRNAFYNLMKRCKYSKINAPKGINLKECLVSMGNNNPKTKLRALKNLIMYPTFRRWKKLNKNAKKIELSLRHLQNYINTNESLTKRQIISLMKDLFNKKNISQMKRTLVGKLIRSFVMRSIFKNLSLSFKIYKEMVYLKRQIEAFCKYNLVKYFINQKRFIFFYLNKFSIKRKELVERKNISQKLINIIINDQWKKYRTYYFNLWKNRITIENIRKIKISTLHHIVSSLIRQNKYLKEKILVKTLFRWRIQTAKKRAVKRLDSTRKTLSNVLNIIRKNHLGEILNQVERISKYKRKKNILCKVLNAYNNRLDSYIIREKYFKWYNRYIKNKEMKEKVRKLFNRYLQNANENKLFLKTIKSIHKSLNVYNSSRNDNVVKIQTSLRSKYAKKEKEMLKSKNEKFLRFLTRSFTKFSMNHIQYFKKWWKKSYILKFNSSALTIQRFITINKNKKLDKYASLNNLFKVLLKWIKTRYIKRLKNKFYLLIKKDFLKKYLFRIPFYCHSTVLTKNFEAWKNKIIQEKQNDAGNLINRNLKSSLAKKRKNELVNKKVMISDLFKKLNVRYTRILKGKFSKLRRICYNQNARIIQAYFRKKMKNKKLFINIFCFYALNIIVKRKLLEYKRIPFLTYRNIIENTKNSTKFRNFFLKNCNIRFVSMLKYFGKASNKRFNDNLIKLQRWVKVALFHKDFKSGKIKKKLLSIESMFTKQLNYYKKVKKSCFINWKNYVKLITFNDKATIIQRNLRRYIQRLKHIIRQRHFCEFMKFILVKIACNQVKSLKINSPRVIKRTNSTLSSEYHKLTYLLEMHKIKPSFLTWKDLTFNKLNRPTDNASVPKKQLNRKTVMLNNDKVINTVTENNNDSFIKKNEKNSVMRRGFATNNQDSTKIEKGENMIHRLIGKSILKMFIKKFKYIGKYYIFKKKIMKNLFKTLKKRMLDNNFSRNRMILKMILLNSKKKIDDLKIKYLKIWFKRNNLLKLNEKTSIIQKYCKSKLKNVMINKANLLFRAFYFKMNFKKDLRKLSNDYNQFIESHKLKYNRKEEISKGFAEYKDNESKIQNNYLLYTELKKKVGFVKNLWVNLTKSFLIKKEFCFNYWRNKSLHLKIDSSAKKIQKFILKQRINKINRQCLLLCPKVIHYPKTNKLTKFFDILSLKSVWKKIKDEVKRRTLIRFHLYLKNKKNYAMKIFFDNFLLHYNKINLKINRNVMRIQAIWRGYLSRCLTEKFLQRIYNIMRRFKTILINNRKLRENSFRKWKEQLINLNIHDSAMKIQNFCMKKIINQARTKKAGSKELLGQMFVSHFIYKQIKPFFKYFSRIQKMSHANRFLKRFIFKNLLTKVINFEKSKLIWKLLRIPENIHTNKMRKYLRKFFGIVQLIQQSESACKIQNKFRVRKRKIVNGLIKDQLIKRLFELDEMYSNLQKYYFFYWRRLNNQNIIMKSAKIINEFVGDNWERIKIKKKYKNFSNKLLWNRYKLEKKKMIECYYKYLSLKKIIKDLCKILSQRVFKIINNRIFNYFSFNKWLLLIKNFDNKNNLSRLCKGYIRFKHITFRTKKLELALSSLYNKLFKHILTSNFPLIVKAYCSIKYRDMFKYLYKSKFMKNLKNKIKFSSNAKLLAKYHYENNENFLKYFSFNVMERIYSIYYFRKLRKAYNIITLLIQNRVKPFYFKEMILKIKEYIHYKARFSYKEHFNLNKNPIVTHIKFHMKKVNMIDRNIENSNIVSRLTPIITNKLTMLISNRKRYFLSKLNELNSQLLSNLSKRIFKRISRKYILGHIFKDSKEVSSILKIMYILKVITMHKAIVKRLFIKSVIRKWFINIHLERMARRKMKTLYKNMQNQYLDAMNSIFSENEKNPGILNEVNNTVFSTFTIEDQSYKHIMRNPLNLEKMNDNEDKILNTSVLNISTESNNKSLNNNMTLNETYVSTKNTSFNRNNYNLSGEYSINNEKQDNERGKRKVKFEEIKKGKK